MSRRTWVLEELADFIAGQPRVGAARRTHIADATIDTMTCAAAGIETQFGSTQVRMAEREGRLNGSSATAIGAQSLSPARAAYFNVGLANALDFEPVGPEGHLLAAVAPSVLAAAEGERATMEAALDAIAVGVEVGARVGLAIRRPAFRATGGQTLEVVGMSNSAIGVAAGLSRLLGLSATQTAHALGMSIYGSPAPLMRRAMEASEVPMTKYDPLSGHATAGFEAVALAREGVRGDVGAADGPFGLWRLYGTVGFDDEAARHMLGDHWYLDEEIFYKKYPVVLYTNPIVQACSDLQAEHLFGAEDVDEISIGHWFPKTGEQRTIVNGEADAWLSLPMSAALGILHVHPRYRWRHTEVIGDALVQRLIGRSSVYRLEGEGASPTDGGGGLWTGKCPYSVRIVAGGQVFERHGSHITLLDRSELEVKWRECLEPLHGENSGAAYTRLSNAMSGSADAFMAALNAEM